jgi:Tol biopolymer transport system component
MASASSIPRGMAAARLTPSGFRRTALFFLRRGAAGGTTIGRISVDGRGSLVAGSENVVAVLTGTLRDVAVAPGSRSLAVAEIEAGFNLTRLPLSADGSRPAGPEEPLNSGSARDRFPVYSFDGQRLAYSSNRSWRLEVWVLDLQTMRQEPLPAPREGLEMFTAAWLPDGRTQMLMGAQIGSPPSLWLLSLDGSRAEQLPSLEIPEAGTIGVSPDGRRLLMHHRVGAEVRLYEMDLATRTERRLTTAAGNTYDGVWSRDGRQIAYISSTDGILQLWTQPAQGGEARQLTFGVERMRHACFSPDGRWIYVQPRHRNIWRVPTAGGPLEKVTTFPESGLFLEEPTLSPDGRALVYARWNGGASLWILRLGSPEAGARAVQ